MSSWLGEPGTIGERFNAIDDAFGRLPTPSAADELAVPLAPARAPAFDGWADGDPWSWLYDERSNGDRLAGLGQSSDFLLPVTNPFLGRSTAAEDDRSALAR
ncbi:MAG: hypothetical protein HYR63_07715 [Proteobacteria bacterium]|nr:hypothetical protein [Pseudomonadota bacterium]